MTREVSLVLMRLYHVTNPERINVCSEPASECTSGSFSAQLGQRIRVHRIVIVVLFKWKRVVIRVALGEAYAVCCFGARDDDLLYTELASSFDDVVGGHYIGCEALIVWDKHISRVRCKVYNSICRN